MHGRFTGLKKTGRNNEVNVRRGSTVLIWAMIPGFSWFWTLKPVQACNIPSFVTLKSPNEILRIPPCQTKLLSEKLSNHKGPIACVERAKKGREKEREKRKFPLPPPPLNFDA